MLDASESSASINTPFPDVLERDFTVPADGAAPPIIAFPTESEAERGAEYELIEEVASELYEPELDEAIEALVNEAHEVLGSALGGEPGLAENLLTSYFAPRVRAIEDALQQAANRLGEMEGASVGTIEIDRLLDEVTPESFDSPAFELFWGGLKKAAQRVSTLAKKGVALAAGPLVASLLGKLTPHLRKVVQRIVKTAIDQLPAEYRSLAQRLAKSLPVQSETLRAGEEVPTLETALHEMRGEAPLDVLQRHEADALETHEAGVPDADVAVAPQVPAVPDLRQIQRSFNLDLAQSLVGSSNDAQELMGDARPMEVAASDPYGELERARVQLQQELAAATNTEEVTVAIERFAPFVMGLIGKLISLIGKPRVKRAVASLIAKLTEPFVGKAAAPGLSRALADVALRFLHAEVSEQDEAALASHTIAATVEETLRRVATLPPAVFEDAELLEAYTLEAFDRSVAANFPPHLVRSELRESELPGLWLAMPHRARPTLYRKHSYIAPVTIGPHVALAVRGFDGSTLASFFRDRLRFAPGPVQARVHLFEATPRTRLARIARWERVRGLGSHHASAWSQLQPLTPEAAGLLLGAPNLGRPLAESADPHTPAIGQRYYFLEIAEAPAQPVGRESHVHLTILPKPGELRVCVYLSEPVAQRMAAALRKQAPSSRVILELRRALAHATSAVMSLRSRRIVSVHGAARDGLTRQARRRLAGLGLRWFWWHLRSELKARGDEIVSKTESVEDGICLSCTFKVPGGVHVLSRGTDPLKLGSAKPVEARLTVDAGHGHGCR